MKPTQKCIEERVLFFSLCCKSDREKLLKHTPMTFHDFERIICILDALELVNYEIYVYNRFPEFMNCEIERIEHHTDIFHNYTDRIEDENFHQRRRGWLADFYRRLPTEELRERYQKKLSWEENKPSDPQLL